MSVPANEKPTIAEQVADRLIDQSPVYLLPRVIASEDYRLSQAAYRQRVEAAHAAGWAAMGMGDVVKSAHSGGGEMGSIIIQRDTHNHYSDQSSSSAPAGQAPAPPVSGTLAKLAGPALLGAALLGTGGGSVALYNYLTKPAANQPAVPPAASDAGDWKLGAEVKNRE